MARKSNIKGVIKFVAATVIIVAAFFLFYTFSSEPEKIEPPVKAPAPVVTEPTVPPTPPIPPPPPSVEQKPVIAIVIDDMGRDLKTLNAIISAGIPVTIAVLPGEMRSTAVATKAHEAGLEVLLHFPMEPKDETYKNNGEGMLSVTMTNDEVKAGTEKLISKVPFITGVNNHMGSLFTEDEPRMRVVMGELKKKDLFFLDSLTTEHSVGVKTAIAEGVKTAARDVFLDNTQDVEYIRKQFESAVRLAKKRGHAIAIGHPYPETIEVIKEMGGILEKSGVVAVKVGDMVK